MLPKRRQKSRSPRCELHDGGASRSEPPPPGSFSFPGGGAWNDARRLSFVRFFGNPLIIVLLVASAVSLSLGDRVGGLIIIAMVLLSVLLNFFMEFHARHAVEEIRKQVATCAVVPHRVVLLPVTLLATIAGLALTYLLLVQAVKTWFYRRHALL